jgi:hypothetical protein
MASTKSRAVTLRFARGVLQRFHFTAALDPKPAFPSRWHAPGSIAGGLRGVWVRAIWRARPFPLPARAKMSPLSKSGRGYGQKFLSGGVEPPSGTPRAPVHCGTPLADLKLSAEHTVKCVRIRLAVSCSPQPQPHFIRGPCGRPRLTLKLLPRRSCGQRAAGRFGHRVKCVRIWRAVCWAT